MTLKRKVKACMRVRHCKRIVAENCTESHTYSLPLVRQFPVFAAAQTALSEGQLLGACCKVVADIFGIDSDSFDEVVILARFPLDEFIVTATPVPTSLNLQSRLLVGWVTVKRRSTGTARTYNAGVGHSWLSFFKRDLIAGIYGKSADS